MSVPSGGVRGAAASAAAEEKAGAEKGEAEPPLPRPASAAAATQPLPAGELQDKSLLDLESPEMLLSPARAHRAGKGSANRIEADGGGDFFFFFEGGGRRGRKKSCQNVAVGHLNWSEAGPLLPLLPISLTALARDA